MSTRAIVPSLWSTEYSAMLSCPRLPTAKYLPLGCMRISDECDAAFQMPCGEIVVFPCSCSGSEERHCASSNTAPGSSHPSSLHAPESH